MNLILITAQLKNKYPNIDISQNQKIIIPNIDTDNNIKFFKTIVNYDITIYDHTKNSALENHTIIDVSDHINKTGHNPIIGKQALMPNNFIDTTNLYKTTTGVITHCLGERFEVDYKNHNNPSHFICYIAILLYALGCKNIKGKLINIL